jgi:selenocysteine lyase/cysteine desulfurase
MVPIHNIDIAAARAAFPALAVPEPFIFADNAGGSQCLTTVIQAVSDYLVHSNVQLGAGYSVSVAATKRIAEAKEAARELFNAASVDEIAFGSSSTQVSENLARALEEDFSEGDEIIITPEHEGMI